MLGLLLFIPDDGGALLLGGTLPPVSPAKESGSLLKALFLLSTRSIGESPASPLPKFGL